MKSRTKGRAKSRGQSLVETGIVAVFLTFMMMGIVDAGWAFLRTNMIMHAVRDGARFGATLDTSLRNAATGCFTDTSASGPVGTHVQNQLNAVGFSGTINVCQGCMGTGNVIPVTKVQVTGSIPTLFFLQDPSGGAFGVNRSVVFQDEGRKCPDNPCAGCGACGGCS